MIQVLAETHIVELCVECAEDKAKEVAVVAVAEQMQLVEHLVWLYIHILAEIQMVEPLVWLHSPV